MDAIVLLWHNSLFLQVRPKVWNLGERAIVQ